VAVDILPAVADIRSAAAANIPAAVEGILVDRQTVDTRAGKDVFRILQVQLDCPGCIRSTCCQPYLSPLFRKICR
jgi:hypothetical protein